MLYSLLVIIHILICIVLALVVLMQSSKGGGLAGAFGGAGGAPQQLLGSRGMTTLLHKMTIYLAVAFFISSFLLFMVDTSGSPRGGTSVVGDAAREGELNVPLQENPLEDVPVQESQPAPAEVPAGQGSEQTTEEATTEGGGN
ncbi:MAG: preprotein translocase subunit SecG [Candidatus Krumholzibacteriota bacterium]